MSAEDRRDEVRAKLAMLKKKRLDASNENRKEVYKERRKMTTKLTDEENETNSKDEKQPERARNWDYTIQEDAEWTKRTTNKNLGSQNMNKLAELTYKKEIEEIKIDKEAYEEAKTDTTHSSDLTHHVDPERAKFLANKIAADNDRRYKRRQNDREDSGNYINEKNRQFNMKLKREKRQKTDDL